MWGGQYHADAQHIFGMRAAAMAGQYPSSASFASDQRVQLRRTDTPDSLSKQPLVQQYTPPQVRSGRGAIRVIGNRGSATSSPTTTPIIRPGISVSNRGKGPRKPAACRPVVVAAERPNRDGSDSPSTTTSDQVSAQTISAALNDAQRIGSAVQGVAVAISRKAKRKLPMAAKKAEKVATHSIMTCATNCDKKDESDSSVSSAKVQEVIV
jgi:hypothetical protein